MRGLLLSLILFYSPWCIGQGSGFGFKGGANYAYLASQATSENEYVAGFHAGMYFPILVRARLELQPEILFSSQGGGYQFPNTTTVSRLNYLSVPVAAKIYVGNWFNIQGGPQLSYLVNARTTFNDEQPEDATEDYFSHDLSFLVGIGFDDRRGLDFSLRYVMGMTTLLREDQVLFPKNRVIQLSLGYRFGQSQGRRR